MPEEIIEKTLMEKMLQEGSIKKIILLRRSNKSFRIKLKGGGAGIFKPKSKEKYQFRQIEVGTHFRRERAAYLISKYLKFDIVPLTVIREIDGEIGSVQQFIDAKTAHRQKIPQDKAFKKQLIKLWIFDYIIYNSDRHDENFLIKDSRIYAIDNSQTFGGYHLAVYQSFFDIPLSGGIKEKIKEFLSRGERKEELRGLLAELLDPKEVDACFKRLDRVGEFVKRGAVRQGEKLTFE